MNTLSCQMPKAVDGPAASESARWRWPDAPQRAELARLAAMIGVYLLLLFLPVGNARFDAAINESLHLARWYAREHLLLCLIPALFIAGAISVFVSQASVMKYLGPTAPKWLAYGVASVSGTILAVCSCTVLPLFAGIWRMGAGLGPATAFLYSGPAINVLAIILTARILGPELGIARAVGAILFSLVIGLLMHLIFRKDEMRRAAVAASLPQTPHARPLWKTGIYFALMLAVLVFANWGSPQQPIGLFSAIYSVKWIITSLAAAGLGIVLVLWFAVPWWKLALSIAAIAVLAMLAQQQPMIPFAAAIVALVWICAGSQREASQWLTATWELAKQILPLLLLGVLVAGFLLGRPGHEGLIPTSWVAGSVGGNSLRANFVASFAGALMYFATLTEVPILQGLIGAGMGKGPALALLLAGPALSLPNMLVLRGVMGTARTLVYVGLVIIMATLSGWVYGAIFA
ncbi:permease [Fontivita pretiosa]|uniref:permease n=1 Tax=Fontivita pretiosa TaxID=2989684 RepID=UPI003D166D97